MKLKLDADGHVVVADGKPVYVHEDGKEVAFDAPTTVATISRLNGEAKGHRERAEKAETQLKVFDGIEDPEAARKAIETIANIDAGTLISAGKVEEIKAAAKKAAEDQIAAANKALSEKLASAVKTNGSLTDQLYEEKIGGAFSRSKYIADKIAVPPDMVQATFGKAFKIEDGKTVAYDHTGNKVYSRARPGELADFDEALETLVDAYPHRDHIVKGGVGAGGGAGGGGAGGGKRTVTRAQFDALDAVAQAETAKAAGKGEVVLTD